MKVKVKETGRATYTSSIFESTIDELRSGGWKITESEEEDINNGGHLGLYSPNGMRKINISKI